MWNLLLAAALATANPLDSVLDGLEASPAEVPLVVTLVPSSLDPDVLWMPYDAERLRHETHWIPPLRLGITEKSLEGWPAQEGGTEFVWSDQLERTYYSQSARRFAHQKLPFGISLLTETSRSQQGCSLQLEIRTSVVSDSPATVPATVRVRTRRTEGQFLFGQSLVVSNLYPFEEVLPVLGDLPLLGRLFQTSTTGPMIVIRVDLQNPLDR